MSENRYILQPDNTLKQQGLKSQPTAGVPASTILRKAARTTGTPTAEEQASNLIGTSETASNAGVEFEPVTFKEGEVFKQMTFWIFYKTPSGQTFKMQLLTGGGGSQYAEKIVSTSTLGSYSGLIYPVEPTPGLLTNQQVNEVIGAAGQFTGKEGKAGKENMLNTLLDQFYLEVATEYNPTAYIEPVMM